MSHRRQRRIQPRYRRASSGLVPGTITVEFDVFRHRICLIEARRWLYDSEMNRHAIPSWTTGLELLAGREVYQRQVTIPDAAVPGPAQYQVVLRYE